VDHTAFGTLGTGNTQLFKGLLHEDRIHDVALTADEVAAAAEGCGELELSLEKTKLTGPDEIGICLPEATEYVFEIAYSGPDALILDSVPAEFEVKSVVADPDVGFATFFAAGKGPKSKSATIIAWWVPAPGSATLTVTVETRESPGGGHKIDTFKPTSCGTLTLNDGATAYEADESGNAELDPDTGEMIPIEDLDPTEPLEVEAVCGAKPCAPENLTVTLSAPTTLSLDWDDVCVGGDPVVYNVYRYGVLIAEGLSESEYDDEGLAPGDYCYEVEAEYVGADPGLESDKSEVICQIVPEP